MVHCWLLLFEIFNKQLLFHVSSRLSSFLTAICAVAVKDLCRYTPSYNYPYTTFISRVSVDISV